MTSLRILLPGLISALMSALAWAQNPTLPPPVTAALTAAHIPLDAVSVLLTDAGSASTPRLSHRAEVALQPASVMKLVTTFAALDLLGPAYRWQTPVWLDGPIDSRGVLKGNLVIQGQGDPTLVLERLWLLLRRVQGLGVQRIDGDIVLDRRAFDVPPLDPASFDGEPLRPYNTAPDALLINFKSLLLRLTPDPANGVARVQIEPPLWGVRSPRTVPLSAKPCGDYRSALKADFSDPQHIRLAGNYAADCGEKVWPVAYANPASYNARAIEGLWRSIGGQLSGSVRDGQAPATPATFTVSSPPLGEVIRDINKYSNNVMAQQLMLTLARTASAPDLPTTTTTDGSLREAAPATFEASRAVLQRWWQTRIGTGDAPQIDNGSGLSRQARTSALALTRLLQTAYASPYMPELMASLPIVGIDGTLTRSQAAAGSAHLKTGSLRDVLALAGYVQAPRGRHWCLVAIVNHPDASAARPALDALLAWAHSLEP